MEVDWKGHCFEVFRERYQRAGRRRKSELLDELCELLGWHRKHAIRQLRKRTAGRPALCRKRGRKSRYDRPDFLRALRKLWLATDQMCSKLLKAALVEWVPAYERHHGPFPERVREDLLRVSDRTIERYLSRFRADLKKSRGGTKPGTLKRKEIPIRGGIWDEEIPGFVEADTVCHGGTTTAGVFVWSLVLTDIRTHWTECRAVWFKGAKGVVAQIKDIEAALPFELLGFDCDNGSEFLNNHLIRYFAEKKEKNALFSFTRSRPYRKNDNAHVEQRNWSHPRQLFGRERLDFLELVPLMNDLYANEFALLRNHFYPTMKLDQKVMVLSRYRRRYGDPMTPYERVLASPYVPDERKNALHARHETLDPIDLRLKLEAKLRKFWTAYRALRKASLRAAAA